MGRMIDADKLSADMYHEAFEKDSDMQKWDSGCWIRYKMFENVLKAQPTVQLGTNLAEVGTDLISRQAVTKFLNDWLSCLFENCHKQSASDLKMIIKDFKNLPSAQPDIIRCKDCKYYKYGICMKIGANKSFHGFCDWAERGEQDE